MLEIDQLGSQALELFTRSKQILAGKPRQRDGQTKWFTEAVVLLILTVSAQVYHACFISRGKIGIECGLNFTQEDYIPNVFHQGLTNSRSIYLYMKFP